MYIQLLYHLIVGVAIIKSHRTDIIDVIDSFKVDIFEASVKIYIIILSNIDIINLLQNQNYIFINQLEVCLPFLSATDTSDFKAEGDVIGLL